MASRGLARWLWRRPWWLRLAVVAATPLCVLNLAVAIAGSTPVFPLSPFFLKEKVHALQEYGRHRPGCLLRGHGNLQPLIAAAERRYGLPPTLLEALVEVESHTEPHRISAAGAMGPGQLTAGTAALLGVEDPFEPAQAIDGSARYLAAQLKRFGDVKLALAAYNAGPGAVRGKVPQNGETEFYVPKVLAEYERRRGQSEKPSTVESRGATSPGPTPRAR